MDCFLHFKQKLIQSTVDPSIIRSHWNSLLTSELSPAEIKILIEKLTQENDRFKFLQITEDLLELFQQKQSGQQWDYLIKELSQIKSPTQYEVFDELFAKMIMQDNVIASHYATFYFQAVKRYRQLEIALGPEERLFRFEKKVQALSHPRWVQVSWMGPQSYQLDQFEKQIKKVLTETKRIHFDVTLLLKRSDSDLKKILLLVRDCDFKCIKTADHRLFDLDAIPKVTNREFYLHFYI